LASKVAVATSHRPPRTSHRGPPLHYDREYLTGTVGVLILSLLVERPMYGYEILREAERRSARQFLMKEGTLYPALHQMERAGLLRAEWRESETGRARKYYTLTAKGRRHAESKRRQWESISAAMRTMLGDAHA
jgi:PadR family transcriptional regulator, regulatory protein PadR